MQHRGSSSAHVVPTKVEIHLRCQHLMAKLIQRIEFAESAMSVAKVIHCDWKWSWHHSQCCQMATKFPIPVHLNPRTLTSSYPSEKWSQLCVPSCLQIDGCLSRFHSRWIDIVEFQHSANNEQFESKSKIGNGQFTLSPDSERIAQTKCAKIFCLTTFPSGCQQKMQVSSADLRDTHEVQTLLLL